MKRRKIFAAGAFPDTASRRLLITPSYFLLIWRWSTWFYALIVVLGSGNGLAGYFKGNIVLGISLFAVTLGQTLIGTLYGPVLQVIFPRLLHRKNRPTSEKLRKRLPQHDMASDDNIDELIPLVQSSNRKWNMVIYGLDVVICGLVMYFSAAFSTPPFGAGSVFYRYGMSTVLAAASAYGYRGGLIAAFSYDFFAVLGFILPAPGLDLAYFDPTTHHNRTLDILTSVIDTPIIAVIVGYFISLINKYANSRRRESYNARLQRSLVTVGQTLLQGMQDRQELLERSAKQILQGGFFERVIIMLTTTLPTEDENQEQQPEHYLALETSQSAQDLPDDYEEMARQVLQTHQKYITFQSDNQHNGPGLARFYMPLDKDKHIHIILGAESRRSSPFGERQEKFLEIAGSQLLIALENAYLTEQMIQLAAIAERGRIAREIHDGIAQLVYMLSLNIETCQAQALRLAETSAASTELLAPLVDRLGRLVTISKQALWETRNYMFSLRPLMSGDTTLTQTLTNQLREFETISDLPTTIEIDGEEEQITSVKRQERRYTQVGTAIFRILQETLTNVYKHAKATQVHVKLRFLPGQISLEVRDNGRGISQLPAPSDKNQMTIQTKQPSIYSGHGIGGMQERAAELGGKVSIHRHEAGGTIVHIEFPL